MKKLMNIAVAIIIVIGFVIIGMSIHNDKQIRAEWEDSREVHTIVISSGDDLWSIAEYYKPSWMDPREYIYEVKKLNNMSQSYIYAGEQLLIYI